MCYINEGDSNRLLYILQFNLHVLTELEVKCAKRLVKQKHAGVRYKCTGNCNTLLLTAGKGGYTLVLKADKRNHTKHLCHSVAYFLLLQLFKAKGECNILINIKVGEEGVFLENRVYLSLVGGNIADFLTVEVKVSAVCRFKAANDTKGGGFTASRRAEKCDKFFISDVKIHIVYNGFAVIGF